MHICEVRTRVGKAYLFVVVDRTSKFVPSQLYRKAQRERAAEFLENVQQQLRYQVHTVLTDNDAQFAKRPGKEAYKPHRFNGICHRFGIENRLARTLHP
ncbi:MAG: DDE-type integrase/transposase/recombinase [Halomonas sp.]|jgi:hypothetical protein|nr:DDE-type integrase/transposase/recombinase [Halomonas sp.]MBL1267548.1 DDE-type integrase/transposase/recombinase [Halomonas sp.]|tara:strand:+ start:8853 stop:9149 length:297 start_codon:yes stop_codon:yes gene_type:complete